MPLSLGELSVVFLGTLLLLEVLILVGVSRHLLSSPFDKDESIKPEGREYASRALNLGGLTFAAIAFLAGSFWPTLAVVIDSLYVLVFSLGLLLVSYYIEVLVRLRRVYWVIQDKTLNFGYLSIVVALVLFFNGVMPIALPVILIVSAIVFAVHLVEYATDFRHWRERGREGFKSEISPEPKSGVSDQTGPEKFLSKHGATRFVLSVVLGTALANLYRLNISPLIFFAVMFLLGLSIVVVLVGSRRRDVLPSFSRILVLLALWLGGLTSSGFIVLGVNLAFDIRDWAQAVLASVVLVLSVASVYILHRGVKQSLTPPDGA